MSRNLTPDVVAEVTGNQVQPFLLFEGVFSDGIARTWSGIGDLSWNGFTWAGTGTLLSISAVEETAETSANGLSVTISGIPSELVSLSLNSVRQGALGKVYLGFLSTGAIISNPLLVFEGKLDVAMVNEEEETATITLSYESRLIDLQRPRESRYTDEDQQRAFAGDLGCQFVAALQDKSVVWGRA